VRRWIDPVRRRFEHAACGPDPDVQEVEIGAARLRRRNQWEVAASSQWIGIRTTCALAPALLDDSSGRPCMRDKEH
jgi:hypothetical protein